MKRAAMGIISAGLALAWVLTVVPVDAQLRSSGQPRGIGPTGSRPTVETPQDTAAPVLRNQWLQGDERQQEQLVGCYRLSAILANHSREVRKMLVAGEVDWKGVTGQYEDLKRGMELLTEKHDEFSLELNNGQRSWWERPLQEIMAIQLRLHDQTATIRRELNGEKPGKAPMAKAFIDLEDGFRKWNRLYGQIGTDMNMPDLEQRAAPGKIRGLPGAQNPGR